MGKIRCLAAGLMEGIDQSHQLWIGWMHGEFSMIFCVGCGRWRCSAGRGLLGGCDTAKGQLTRVTRVRAGKHPVSGLKFDKVTRPTAAMAWRGAYTVARSGYEAEGEGNSKGTSGDPAASGGNQDVQGPSRVQGWGFDDEEIDGPMEEERHEEDDQDCWM